MPEDTVEEATGLIDVDTLERIVRRLDGSTRFATVSSQPTYAPNSVVAEYDLGYFPAGVTRAYLRTRWFETNDFSVHYSNSIATSGDGSAVGIAIRTITIRERISILHRMLEPLTWMQRSLLIGVISSPRW